MSERLYRSNQEKIIGGVCGGLAEFFKIDPIIIRIFFVLWVILGEWGMLAYFALWLIIPPQQYEGANFQVNEFGARFQLIGQDIRDLFQHPSSQLLTYGGAALITVGLYTLLRSLDLLPDWNMTIIWAALLIVGGVFVLVKTLTKKK
jgi:phage shock protein PspC (stress-responsive transcriptional regulator)